MCNYTLDPRGLRNSSTKRLHFLRRLKKVHLPKPILILSTFYTGTIESILTSFITVWYGNWNASNHRALQRIVWTAERIIGSSLPSLQGIYTWHWICKAISIMADPHHLSHQLFTPLPSGRLEGRQLPETEGAGSSDEPLFATSQWLIKCDYYECTWPRNGVYSRCFI